MAQPQNKTIRQIIRDSGVTDVAVIRVLASMDGIPRGKIAAAIEDALEYMQDADPFEVLESSGQAAPRAHILDADYIDITPEDEQ